MRSLKKVVNVSQGSTLARVRHFCAGEVRQNGILGVELLQLCLSSKLCKLCFCELETTFWRSEKVKTFHIFSHYTWRVWEWYELKFPFLFPPVKRRLRSRNHVSRHPHEKRREARGPEALGDSPSRLFEGERQEADHTAEVTPNGGLVRESLPQ